MIFYSDKCMYKNIKQHSKTKFVGVIKLESKNQKRKVLVEINYLKFKQDKKKEKEKQVIFQNKSQLESEEMIEELHNLFVKACFKLNKKINIYITRKAFRINEQDDSEYVPALKYSEKRQMRQCDFRIGRPSTFYDKRTYCVNDIKEMMTTLEDEKFLATQIDKIDEEKFQPMKFSFYFKKQIVFLDLEKNPNFFLDQANYISFKKCSAQLILNACLKGNFKTAKILKIEECPISDPDFLELAQKLEVHNISISNDDNQYGRNNGGDKKISFTFNDVEIYIKKCSYLSYSILDYLKVWDNGSFSINENKLKGNGFCINSLGFLRSTTLLQFSTCQYFKQLKKLKVKSHPQYANSGNILALLLTSRNFTKKSQADIKKEQRDRQEIDSAEFYNEDEEEEIEEPHSEVLQDDGTALDIGSNLQRLSFDYSVCNNFDDLPLNCHYYQSIVSLSYNAYHKQVAHTSTTENKNSNNLTTINFSTMFPYSLKKLSTLKLKSCNLDSKFFSNIEVMHLVQNLQIINFSYCQIDMASFRTFIINSKLKSLKSLILRQTSIDDQFCYLISDKSVVSFQLEEIDISKVKTVSLKGIKYLTFIDTLRCLNIKGMDQINCQFSTFLIDLMERKRNLYIKSSLEDIELNQGFNLCELRMQAIEEIQKSDPDFQKQKKQRQTFNNIQLIQDEEGLEDKAYQGDFKLEQQSDINQDDIEDQYNIDDELNDEDQSKKEEGEDDSAKKDISNKKKDSLVDKGKDASKRQSKQDIKVELPPKINTHPKYELLREYTMKCPQITHIDMSGCKNVTTPLIEDLFRHRIINRLNYLNLSQTKVCNNLIDIFKQSQDQETEGVAEFWESYEHKMYDPMQEVQVLQVCDNQFIHQNLKFFSIKDSKIIRGFKMVFMFKSIKLENLQDLDVSNCNIFDQSLIELSKNLEENYPNLTRIKMAQIKSSPTGIQALRKMPAKKVVFIDLKQTNFDDNTSLIFFSSEKNELLKTLHYLSVKDCKQLTTTGLEAMIDGLAGSSAAEIFSKRFNVSEEEAKKFEDDEKLKKQKFMDQQKILIDEMKKQLKEQKKRQKKRNKIDSYPNSKKPLITQADIDALKKNKNTNKVKDICENFDVFGLLSDCQQLVTDSLFTLFLHKLGHVVQNIYELNLNKMGRLTLDQFQFENNNEIDPLIFKNLEILNINETRITTKFARNFLAFWIASNTEKKSLMSKNQEEFKMKYFMILKCQKAHFVSPQVLHEFVTFYLPSKLKFSQLKLQLLNKIFQSIDQFFFILKKQKHVSNIRQILSKTHFKMELLLNELGLKIMDDHLHFMSDLKSADSRFVSINITELNLENNQFISQQGFSTILRSNWMKYILRLNVRNTQFGNSQIEQMSQMMKEKRTSSQFQKLQYLGMRGCIFVSKRGLSLLCQMEKLSNDFDLGCVCELKMLIDEELMKDMAQSLYCKNMEFLDLSDNGFQKIDKGIKYICFKGRDVKLKLKIINVSSTWISDKALQSIAVTENLSQLEKIIIKDSKRITERGLSYLIDSRHLPNLDLFYLFGSNTYLLSGRVIDTMKNSDRKKSIKELSLVGSLSQDKEINNIMQEIISGSFKIKTLDLRKTSHVGPYGLAYIYNMIQWNIIKNQKVSCCLKILIIDNTRYQEFKSKNEYQTVKTNMEKLPDLKIKEPDFTQYFVESEQYKAVKKNFKPSKGSMTIPDFQKKCKDIFTELRHKIVTSSTPQKLNDHLPGDFIQNLFLSANNLSKFKYDYFIKKFVLNIDDTFMDSLTLCDQKFQTFKDTESPNDQNQVKDDNAINKFALLNKKQDDTQQEEDNSNRHLQYPTFKKQFEYFDIRGNKILSDDSVCRFFLSTQMVSQLRTINISFTLLTEKVVLAICASPYLKENLEVMYFSRCPKLSVKLALEYLLMTDFKQFKYKSVLSEYHYDINDEILALMLTRFTEDELRFLNLQNSKISSKGLVLLEQSDKNEQLYLLDLEGTGIEPQQLNDFMTTDPSGKHLPFPPNLKYMWLENTYNLTDEEMNKLSFWKTFQSKTFDFMEMVQSKANKLNLTLKHLTNIELRNLIFRKSYFQLDIYPYITPDVLITLINEQFIQEIDEFKDLKYIIVGFRKQHYPALKVLFNWYDHKDLDKILHKYCFRITRMPLEYQNIPLLKLTARSLESNYQDVRESIQFDFHNYLSAMSYEDILKINKFVEHSHLLKLDFQNTDISGNLFIDLCKIIQGDSNRITEVSLKGIETIRDEHIIAMMFDEEMTSILDSFSQIYTRNQTMKASELKKMKKIAEQQVQQKIRQISKKKKFPYLITLNIENTKVTQYSLLQILKLTPFNLSFRIEKLFEQYSNATYTKLDDHVISELSTSPYLQNFKTLNLEKILCTSNTLGKLMRSQKAINISEMILNTTNLSEDAFITLANSTNLPKLEQIKCVYDTATIRKSYHYIMRAQYLSMNLKTDEIIKKQDVMDTSQFIQAMMNSFYTNNIQTIEINGANKFMYQIKSLFKLSLFTQQITKVGLYDVADTIDSKDVWQMIASSKSFPRLTILSVKTLQIREHLLILLNQKFKPLFDMESLLKVNKHLIDDEVIKFISKLPLLLNSKEVDLSDLSNIKTNAWQEFANSKYVVQLKYINFSEGTLLNRKTDSDDSLKKYFFNPQAEMAGQSKCFGLFAQNNFFNLEKIDISNNKGLPLQELKYLLESIKKRQVSVKFKFEDIFIQIIDSIRPLLLINSNLDDENLSYYEESVEDYENKSQVSVADNLQDYLWTHYISGLYELFSIYFLKDREWYNLRHKTLDLTYFQFMRHFDSFQDIFRQIQDLSQIETIKFYDGGFDSVFSTIDMKFLNLKNVKIMNIYGEKSLVDDEGGYQLKNILKQKYIKPYIFNINGFLDNYNMNAKIQNQILEKEVYVECQNELKIYLKFIEINQIEELFKKPDSHYAAQVITLLNQFKGNQTSTTTAEQNTNLTEEEEAENKKNLQELQEKQELFIKLFSESKSFSRIRKIDTPLPLSLSSVKNLLKCKAMHPTYDIQKHVMDLEVDEEYFDLLVKSRFYKNLTRLVIPKFISDKSGDSSDKGNKQVQSKSVAKMELNFEKLQLDKISNLTQIHVIEQIEDKEFLSKLFSQNNVKFNRELKADKLVFTKLNSDQFKNLFLKEMTGINWEVALNLLEKNKSLIEGQVYENLILNKTLCFFLTELIIPESLNETTAGDLIASINKAMKINQYMKQLLVTKLAIKQFPSAKIEEQEAEEQKEDQPSEIKQFLSSLNNVKQIEFSSKVKFGLNEAQILINHTSSTSLSEMILSWVIPKLTKPDLEKLWLFLSNDKEIAKNVSFLSFKSNKHFLSKYALEQKIIELRTHKKTKKLAGKDGEAAEDLGQDDKDKDKEDPPQEEKGDGNNDDQEGRENVVKGNDEDQDDQNEDQEEKGNIDENQDQDQDNKAIQKQIEELQKNSITEDDLFLFLSNFKGLRELDFSETNIDLYHLKKLKTLKQTKSIHFVNFKDCKAFTDCIPFIWFISEDNQPWFQLQKYLSNLPLGTCKNHKQLLKAIFLSKFFKKNYKFFDVEFVMKYIFESSKELIELFSYILKVRVSNIDITSFLQGLPIQMKNFVNDDHIEKICKIYGNLLFLQPELFPSVLYGFNHILQQKNIPTAIRLMYLLNETFQKKVSASSLATIYQAALESDELKQKQIISENDAQIEKLLIKLKKTSIRKRKLLLKSLEKERKNLENKFDSKNLKVLNIIGKKKPVKKAKDQAKKDKEKEKEKAKSILDQEKNNTKNNNEEDALDNLMEESNLKKDNLMNRGFTTELEPGVQDIQEDKNNEDGLDVNNIEGNEENNGAGEDADADPNGDGDGEGEGEGEDGEGEGENNDEDGEEGQNGEKEENDQQADQIGDSNNDQNDYNISPALNFDENEKLNEEDDLNLTTIKSPQLSSEKTPQLTYTTTVSRFGKKAVTQNLKDKQPKGIKYNFGSTIKTNKTSVKNNLNRIYGTQTALKLHKQLINLHLMSESMKNQNYKKNNLDRKLKENEDQIEFIEFELQNLRYMKNNFFAQEVNNLFNFFEVLNLGQNSHLNIYGLNFYVAEHILPWIKMNHNLGELKDGEKRAQKIIDHVNNKQNEDDFEMTNVLNPDHALDDKLIEHLSYLIEKRLKQLRQIDLRQLNVSDDFAEKFSLILSDDKKLEHLTLLDLSNNRRLSPFGLKFLYSSIVNRIPQGFKVILSSTSNDAEHLRIQIQILEKSILNGAVLLIEGQKKQLEKYIKNNKKKLSKPPKIVKKVSIEEFDEEGAKKVQNLQLEIFDPNMPIFSDVFDEDNKNNEIQDMENDLNIKDYESVNSEDERRKKLLNGELQFLFQKEVALDVKIVRKLEKNSEYKKKIERLRNFQLAYRKAVHESGYQSIASQTDIRLVVQNVVNLGLYSAINILVRDSWKKNKGKIIFFSILFFPLTIFHLMMVATYSITLFLQKNQIELKCKFGRKKLNQTTIELDKLVPDYIENTDFFFDEDVAQIDILLSRNKKKKMPTDLQRRNGRLICEYLNKPKEIDFKKTYQKINNNTNTEVNMLRYIDVIILFNLFVFTIFICCFYTYYIIFKYIPEQYPEKSCKNIPLLFDVPFYVTGLIVVAYEAALLQNIQKVIVSKKIFNFKSLFVLFQLYNSFMQRYNLYTDMIFAFNIYYCDKAPDLGIISLCILGVHLLLQSFSMLNAFYRVQEVKYKMNKQNFHNTTFINLYTKIALIQDFSGLSSVLDRFSTSSTITLEGWYVPKQLSNVKIPQILLTKFQKVFLEDIPQMTIVLLYNFRFSKSTNLLEWENLRVLLTTVLSMYNSLNSAWQAHPSIFRTYQMQDYLVFRQDISEIYKVKVTKSDEEKFHHLSIPKVISKTLAFNQKYTIKQETKEDELKKKRLKQRLKQKKDKDAQSSKGPNSVAASSAAISDNKSVTQSEKSIQSQNSIKSRTSQHAQPEQKSVVDKSLKQLSEEEFKKRLIETLLEKEKSNFSAE